jgi:hypothetical protein
MSRFKMGIKRYHYFLRGASRLSKHPQQDELPNQAAHALVALFHNIPALVG